MTKVFLREIVTAINDLGLRKWSTSIYFFTGECYLRFHEKVTNEGFNEVVFWLIVAVFFANVAEHFIKAKFPLPSAAAAEEKPGVELAPGK